MKKIIICKGLPASGKSTFAKEVVRENKGSYKRINKDELRAMLDVGQHSKSNEKFVLMTRNYLLLEALRNGKHVIVDDTNLAPKHEEEIRKLATEYCEETGQEIKIEVKFFDVSPEECIKRDLKRSNSVGADVIRRMHKQYLAKNEVAIPKSQDESLPKAIICDLDGTLALMNGRNPFDASNCEKDLLNKPIANLVKHYKKEGFAILLLSGRHDTYKEETKRWLSKHEIEYDLLLMRSAKDFRKDSIVKSDFYHEFIHGKYYVDFVLDDRNQVVDLWRNELGLTCLQVNYGDF
ncbi:MAG: AAA family ATPase [Bacteroidota bacterium]